MAGLERKVSQKFDSVEKELKELKGLVTSFCANFSSPSTSFSYEDLFSHPPSPPYTKPATTSEPTPPTTIPMFSVSLAIIPVAPPQPQPSPPISHALSPISQLPPLLIPFTLPSFSAPSASSLDADKRGEKNSKNLD
ncbi:merozoite surface protein CMZ-8-like [Neltuma alba]|uniref:merozoite surface protein CMZ-8-like n=1 Tax=Neltuma alba TaxID=207710 RepID=UPI0010A38D40|nr:merozoite surface protein CMZ-8-like [Prosopis alba]